MNPLAPAAGLTLCLIVALRGWVMVRRPPAAVGRFDIADPDQVARSSVLDKVRERLSVRLAPRALGLLSTKRRRFLRHRLDAAGAPMTLEGYAGQKGAQAVLYGGIGLLLFSMTGSILLLPVLAYLGWLSVDLRLARQAKRRQATIDADLPDFLDILSVIVSAGSGFRQGLDRVADAVGGPLGEEVRLTLRQMDLGSSRRVAFEALRDRNDSEPLAKFITALLQAEELGSPLTKVLGEISEDMRREFQQLARRKAAEATPRVGLLVTTIVLPGAILLVIVGIVIASGALGGFS